MDIYLDTAKIEEIKEAASWGVISGVTTNSSLMMCADRGGHQEITREICDAAQEPISSEVVSPEAGGTVEEVLTIPEKNPETLEGRIGIAKAKHRPRSEMAETGKPINLGNFDDFRSHPWVLSIIEHYTRKDAILAWHAAKRLTDDLEDLNNWYVEKHNRVAFTTIDGRVKSKDSLLRKLHKMCCESVRRGITQSTLQEVYSNIKDLCGVRFSCPYFDEVKPAIAEFIRPNLSAFGYATDLQDDPRYQDKDYLDEGDEFGYRSYHFFVMVPTPKDIYGNVDMCLCEVQARTELQHVWAVKSHNLFYKPNRGWDYVDKHVFEDMRQLSHSLRVADQSLVSIRDRLRGEHGGHVSR